MSGRQRITAAWAFVVLVLAVRAFARGLLGDGDAGVVRIRPCAIDLNRAAVEELQVLPGIGAARAEAIVLERIRAGPFRSPADLLRIHGLGPATVAALAPFVHCSGVPRPQPAAPGAR